MTISPAFVLRKVVRTESVPHPGGGKAMAVHMECGHSKVVHPVPEYSSYRSRCPDCLAGVPAAVAPAAPSVSQAPHDPLCLSFMVHVGQWRAECPAYPGFIFHGATQDESERRLKDALRGTALRPAVHGERSFRLGDP
jgi:hypothetical protein